ncbi:serine protease grass-like [Drosophila tropicalis]|uniref:serine protease grass-like n=1 Tax=Drosophila tropicalis TaxID=46794 RepID=UPI0035AC0EA7
MSSFNYCKTVNNQQGQCIQAIDCPGQQYDGCSDRRDVVCCVDEVNYDGLRQLNQSDICGIFGDEKIKNGFEVAVHSRPWMALLTGQDTNDVETLLCGGTLITPRFVLSAAHCFMDHRYIRIIRHEHYHPQLGLNDIALVELNKEVKYEGTEHTNMLIKREITNTNTLLLAHIRPICLPIYEKLRDLSHTKKFFKVTGWGITEVGNFSDVLREVILPRAHHNLCTDEYALRRRIGRNHICVGSKDIEKDSCNGDSGGPLFTVFPYYRAQRFVQMGIVSFGRQCSSFRAPAVYTNVAQYVPWISRMIVS